MARTRQLTAIIFARIAGYAALMQQDESRADEIKANFRSILAQNAERFHGKILQDMGGGTLAIFPSAVEAVQCAIEAQQSFRKEPGIPVKLGIHLGEIIYSEDEVIGAGVEVASNLGKEAEAGSILISGKIYDEVKNQSGIETTFLRTCCLDETDQPMEMYAISNEGLAVPEHYSGRSELVLQETESAGGLIGFWNELKRRKVVRVVTVYAAAAYIILEFVDIIEDDLGLPDWTGLMLIILLCIGLAITAILSWVYDITPEGFRKTQPGNGVKPSFFTLHGEGESDKPTGKSTWFRRNRVLKRYIFPVTVFVVLFLVIRFWEPLFNNPDRLKEQALIHADNAKIYLNSSANLEIVKGELDLALALDSNCASALNTYAMVYLAQGDTLEAKQSLFKAIKSDPGHSMALSNLAAFAIMEDSIDMALDYTLKAVETDPANANAAYTMAAQLRKRGRLTEAEVWYRKAIQMDSTFVEASSALGALYNDLERPVEAILVLQKSIRLVPDSPGNFRIYKNLAEAHFQLEEYNMALGYLGQSKSLAPEFPETEKCYARLYEATDETEMSIQHWQRYMVLETDSLLLAEAQHHLDSLHSAASN